MIKNIFKYFLLLIFAMQFVSCDENEKQLFDSNFSGIYFYTRPAFDAEGNPGDSIDLNFQYLEDAIKNLEQQVYVTMAGDAKDYDRTFKLVVDAEETTALEGVHYQKLEDTYTFGKGLFYTSIPVPILRAEDLKENSYDLVLNLTSTEDFELGLGERLSFKIKVSDNLLEAPKFWTRLIGFRAGLYHPIKCKKFIEIAGVDGPNWSPVSDAELDIFIKQTRKWFEENPTYDENGNRLYFQ